ncbi:YcaO-like family protein [Nocardioides limicola]|uniref:YcaO-like family protein n=1 Tax=Nocardioides limicola TaxID=2803368 RepID=UPI00193C7D92|nr:YcaO-like family protein [Nocardioides sp. DJM-14]
MTDWNLLVDPRTGIVTETQRYDNPPEWPTDFHLVTTAVADSGHDRAWRADRISTGTAYGDVRRATMSALGEAVERYCGNFVPADLRRASWRELATEGTPALDPATLRLHSEEQYRTPGFPCQPFTRDVSVCWVPGSDLVTGAETLVPASLVYVNYLYGPRAGEPVTNFVAYAGLAAGPDRAWAETSALEEIIERDAVELWWDSGAPARRVQLPPEVTARMSAAADPLFDYVVLEVPGPWRVPVLAVVVRDPVLDIVALGSAARPDAAEAVLKAAGEAVSVRSLGKGLLDPAGGPYQAATEGMIDGSSLKPWRADRRYLDSYAEDFRDVTDLLCQAQIHLDPRSRPWTDRLFTEGDEVPLAEVQARLGFTAPARDHYRDECIRVTGEHPISVDVTTPDVAEVGLAVVRVTAPGTYGNAPAAFQPRDPTRRSNRNRVPLPHT